MNLLSPLLCALILLLANFPAAFGAGENRKQSCYLLAVSAHKYLKAGEPELAVPILERALALDPTSIQAHCKMADALCLMGKFKQSILECDKALSLNAQSFEAYHRRALAKAGLKDYVSATADANKAIEIAPRKAKFYQTRANIFAAQGHTAEAVKDIHKYLSLTPANDSTVPGSYLQTASLYRTAGNFSQERSELSKLITIDKACVDAYRLRGDSYFRSKNFSEARKDYRQALHFEPDNEHCSEYLRKAELEK